MAPRACSKTSCHRPAVATLTYVYADSTAVLGPLSRQAEPHAFDLCREHTEGLTVPRGWEIIRVPGRSEPGDELSAIADAVDEKRARRANAAGGPRTAPAAGDGTGRPRLRIVRADGR